MKNDWKEVPLKKTGADFLTVVQVAYRALIWVKYYSDKTEIAITYRTVQRSRPNQHD